MALALGQIQAKGKLSGQEILQLVNAGVSVTSILEEMGYTLDDVSKGLVSSDEFLAKFSETMDRDFGGAAARMTNSWSGLLSSFEDIKKIGLRELFAGIFEQLQPLVQKFAEWLQGDGLEKLKEWGVELGKIAKKVIETVGALSNIKVKFEKAIETGDFQPILDMVSGWFVDITTKIHEEIDKIDWQAVGQKLADDINAIDWSVAGNALTTGIMNLLDGAAIIVSEFDWGAVWDSIVQSVAEFIAGVYGDTFEKIRADMDEFWFRLGMGLTLKVIEMRTTISTFITEISTKFEEFKTKAVTAFETLRSKAMGALSPIKTAFDGISKIIDKILIAVGKLIIAFGNLVLPAIPGFGGGGGGGSLGGFGANAGFAHGTNGFQVVPPGFPNDSFLAGLTSGEAFSVMTKSQQRASGNSGGGIGTTINITYAPGVSLASPEELERYLLPTVLNGIRQARLNA